MARYERPSRLPPLNALRVFHAVVRNGSIRSAAAELLVTPQAVSQQIKWLEDTLGRELFSRRGRAIEPNENAILLSHFVQSAFDELAEGVRGGEPREMAEWVLMAGGPRNTYMTGENIIVSGGYIYA